MQDGQNPSETNTLTGGTTTVTPSVSGAQPVSAYASTGYATTFPTESSLEQPQQAEPQNQSNLTNYTTPTNKGSLTSFSKRKALFVSSGLTLTVMLISGISIFLLTRNQDSLTSGNSAVPVQDIDVRDSLETIKPSELSGSEGAILINGDIISRGTLQISDSGNVGKITIAGATENRNYQLPNASGTICLDSNNCSFVTEALLQTRLGSVAATTVNGSSNAVTIQGTSNQINVNTSGATITLSAPQDINTTSSVQFGNLTLPSNGIILANSIKQTSSDNNLTIDAGSKVITFTAGDSSFIFPTGGGASQTICTTGVTCAAGGGQAVLLAPIAAQTDNTAFASIFINDTGTGNLLQLQSSGVNRLVVDNTGNVTGGNYNSQTISSSANFTGTLAIQGANSLTLGTASTNTGSILFKGSGSANTLTLVGPTNPSTNTLTLPNETGTLCSTGSVCTGYAPSTGGAGYIQNGTSTQSNANFNIQSASAASIGGIIQGATSQTADLLQLRNSAGANLLQVSAGGNQETLGYINGPSGGIGRYSNRLVSSEAFQDTDFWIPTVLSPVNMSVTADDAPSNPAPNGTQTADKLVSNAANAGLYQSFLTTVTGNYTFSVWLKTNSGTAPVNLRIDSTGGTPATGTAASFTATTTWQRLTVTQNITGTLTAVKPTIILPNNATTVAAWGAQTVYGTDPQVYVHTLSVPINTQYNGVVSNGSLYASSNEGHPTLRLENELGGYLLQGLNAGASVLTISNAGALYTSSTVTGLTGVIGGNSSLNTRSLIFTGNALDQVASITTAGGLGTDFLVQTDNGYCGFGPCTSGGDITLQTGSGGTNGIGGNIYLAVGASGTSSSGGLISLVAGTGGSSAGTGGALILNAGNGGGGNSNGGAVSIQSGAGTGSGVAGAINIGTTTAASSIDIGSSNVAGTISIGGASQTGSITFGKSTAAQTINIGSANATTGAQSINIGNGTTGANTTVNILSGVGTAGSSTLNLANNTRVTTINLGNIAPAAARNTTIAGGNSTVVDTVNIGTGNTTIAGGKVINIGTGTPPAGGSNTISIGTGGTDFGTVNVSLGSKGFVNNTTLIQGGTSNLSGGEAIMLQTHDSGGIAIGSVSQIGTITLGQSAASNIIYIGSGDYGNNQVQTIKIGNSDPLGNGRSEVSIGSANASSYVKIYGGINDGGGSGGYIEFLPGNGGILLPAALPGAADSTVYLCRNSSRKLTTCSTTATGAAFIQGGNDFGATALLGTTLANSLQLITSNIPRLTIDTSGNATLTGNLTVQGTGNSSFDTNTLFINASSNRVGIGTVSPGAALEVTGDIYLTKEAARTIKLADSTTATTAGAQLSILGANGNDASGGAIAITGGNASTSGLTINTGGAITVTGGNGANAQGGAVTVKGGSGQIFLGSTGGAPVTLQGGDGSGTDQTGGNIFITGGQGTGTGSGGGITFRTAPAATTTGSSLNGIVPRLRIQQDGNVGIGTTSPTSLLHLVGSQPVIVAGSGTNATQVLQITGGKGGDTSGTTGQTGGTGAVLNLTAGAGGDAPAGSTNGNGGSITLQGGAPGAGVGTAGSYGNLILQSSGGDVGIGTASLGLSKLVSAVSSSSTSQYQNVAGALGLVNTNTTDNNWVELYFGDDSTNNAAAAISTKLIDHVNNYGDLHLSTKSASGLSSKLVVLSDGKVGIGDVTPAALFTVGSGDLFQVNSSGAIAAVVGITTSGNILPNAAGTIDLGSSTAEFDELYIGDNNGIKLGLDQDATLAYDEATDDRVELTGTGASMFIEDRLGFGLQTLTLTDDGTANDTLTPTATYIRVEVDETLNAGVPDLVISEASAKDGDLLIIVNNEQDASNDTFTITNSAGVVHVPGGTSVTIGPNDSIMLLYMSDRWVTVSFENN